jgi:hypothetical protein
MSSSLAIPVRTTLSFSTIKAYSRRRRSSSAVRLAEGEMDIQRRASSRSKQIHTPIGAYVVLGFDKDARVATVAPPLIARVERPSARRGKEAPP